MSRESIDQYNDKGLLVNGYDNINQAWVQDGKYVSCGHAWNLRCTCFGRRHVGAPSICWKGSNGVQRVGNPQGQVIFVSAQSTLLQEWLLFAEGLLDKHQLQQLVKRSKSFIEHRT